MHLILYKGSLNTPFHLFFREFPTELANFGFMSDQAFITDITLTWPILIFF